MGISIFKSVINPDPNGDCIVNSPGDEIPYRIVVKNEGKTNLTNVTVSDPMLSLPEKHDEDSISSSYFLIVLYSSLIL
jgi:uncharacterized repeat protein (TIGR01451 family)